MENENGDKKDEEKLEKWVEEAKMDEIKLNRKKRVVQGDTENTDEMMTIEGKNTTRIIFKTIKLKMTIRWKVEKKRRQKTVSFEQTISPFNVGEDGKMKTQDEIKEELEIEAKEFEEKHYKGFVENYTVNKRYDIYF